MKTERSHSEEHRPLSNKPQFGGTVEIIPTAPQMIEFIGSGGVWGFPINQSKYFLLSKNPEHKEKSNTPPDQLALFYPTAIVALRGWRLELMVGPLLTGRVYRVHAEKWLGSLIIEEPWVSEIHVITSDMEMDTLAIKIKARI